MTIRILFATAAALTATPAFAHFGHVGELAGHSHWIGLAALGAIAVIIGAAKLKGARAEAEGDQGAAAAESQKA